MLPNTEEPMISMNNELERRAWYARLALGDWPEEKDIPEAPKRSVTQFVVLP